MRREMTYAEVLLWTLLRNGQLGTRFRRQQPIGPYIVDFVAVRSKLIIEADGDPHADSATDVERDSYLTESGYRVLRFWNKDIINGTELVLMKIEEALAGASHNGRLSFDE